MSERTGRSTCMRRAERWGRDGFTLVELLIVIVILGVLAAVVVFAVSGIRDQGSSAAEAADERALVNAQEAYFALNGAYTAEAGLVAAGLLKDESEIHDITVAPDASTYTVVPATVPSGGGGGGGGPVPTTAPPAPTTAPPAPTTAPPAPTTAPPAPTPVAVQYHGYDATSLGAGSKKLVIIGSGNASATTLFNNLQTTPLVDTQVVWVHASDVDETDDVNAIIGFGADYFVAAQSARIRVSGSGGDETFVGAYMATTYQSPGFFWWIQSLGIPSTAQLQARL